mgnify:CR=1 FL=1
MTLSRIVKGAELLGESNGYKNILQAIKDAEATMTIAEKVNARPITDHLLNYIQVRSDEAIIELTGLLKQLESENKLNAQTR